MSWKIKTDLLLELRATLVGRGQVNILAHLGGCDLLPLLRDVDS